MKWDMKKCWIILSMLLVFIGCEEANEIFDYDDYSDFRVEVDGLHYEGPVYVDATNWGAMAYIHDKFVNTGVRLLVSEAENAEGGWEFDITSNVVVINEPMSAGVRYYYCLCFPEGWIKSEIKSVVIPDVSALIMKIEQVGDSVVCTMQESISSAFIKEKGFKLSGVNDGAKFVIEGERFAFSVSDVANRYSLVGNWSVYAYVQTLNTYHCSNNLFMYFNEVTKDNNHINKRGIKLSAISEETIGDVDYLKCTVTGYVDSVYFYKDWDDEPQNRFYPDKKVVNEDGTITTYYVKKRFFQDVRMKAFYKVSWYDDLSDYFSTNSSSESYTPTKFNIRNLDDFLEFVRHQGLYDAQIYFSLLTDITLPSDMRFCMDLANVILDGNGHTLDGVSYFPLFRNTGTVKNLKIGTDETIYNVKKGTSSLSTTTDEVPGYFLWDSGYITLENCEIRGVFKVSGREDFHLYNVGHWHGAIDLNGLNDYTKTEYVTSND